MSLFRFCITILLIIVGVLLSSSASILEASSVMFWALIILPAILIYAIALLVIMPSFLFPDSTAQLLRSLARPEAFGNIIQELTSMVEMLYRDSSPLKENSTRKWTFIASRSIYRCTGDFLSGSLASAILVSFLISRHEMPTYVFLIWVILVSAYFMNNKEELPENDGDSTSG